MMDRPILSSEDVDRFVHAMQRFDDARDLLAQAQQVVVTEFGIVRALLAKAGIELPKKEFEVKLYPPVKKRPAPQPVYSSTRDAIFCIHANEVPQGCKCDDDCYCKQHTCKAS